MKPEISKAFYKSLFDNLIDGLAYCQMIFDAQKHPVDFVYLEVNKNFEKLTGLSNVIGKRVSEKIPGIFKSNPELFEIYGRVSLTGNSERFETYVGPLSRWFFVSVYSPRNKFFVAIFQDITSRKKVEKDLEDARVAARNVLEDLSGEKAKVETASAKEEAVLMSIGDGLLATDEEGHITLINTAAEKMLGRTMGEVLGKVFFEVIPVEGEKGESIPVERRPMSMALISRTTTSTTTTGGYAYCYVRKDKTKFPVAITVTPVILSGKLIGTIEVFRDITREKEIDKAKGEFVSLASHQLRTPTTAISWYSEMLLAGEIGDLNEKQKEYLQEINHGNRRMIDIVNTLLSVSRMELGTFTVQQESVDIVAIAEDVLKELQIQIDEKELEVEKDYGSGISPIESDQKLIRMIFQNLLSNAISYTSRKGKIYLEIKKMAQCVHFRVKDNGCGIPQSVQSEIYTKFFRADNVRVLKPDGIGLGLYITKSIVEALGGTIEFKSKEGEGTIFSVNIPSRGVVKGKT